MQQLAARLSQDHTHGNRLSSTLINSTIDFAVFVAATLTTYFFQISDRPISAALIYLVGVTIIGARSGLVLGILAALTATVIYSFLLTEPLYQFGSYTSDHIVPLIAFNISVILSGAMAGRLNDRALAAENAEQRNAFLLKVSDDLQKSLTLEDVAIVAQYSAPFRQIASLEIYIVRNGRMVAVSNAAKWQDTADSSLASMRSNKQFISEANVRVATLYSAGEGIGAVIFGIDPDADLLMPEEDLEAFTNLLNITIERCLLMERLAQTEVIQKSDELKTAILSSVSHDLRTPLTAIAASATSLKYLSETLKSEDKTAMLETILEQCERLNRYTSNILYMGQLQYGISDDQIENVDVVDILGSVIQSVRTLFPALKVQKNITVSVTIIRANPVMLEQMFFNIIENAAKYGNTAQGIKIIAKSVDGNMEFSIIDWGCGIPAEEQALVFDNFYRTAQTRRNEGNGLGLAIAKGFAEAFGGTIKVVSPHSLGNGTEMVISLPIIIHDDGAKK